MATELEIVQRGPQFEESRTLSARQFERSAEICLPHTRFGVGAGAKPQKFGIVEMHPGVLGELQRAVEPGAGRITVSGRDQQPPEDAVKERDVDVQL